MARILIVDDEAAIADLLSEVVKRLGHEPTIAVDGYTAMPAFHKTKPDLVILDYSMPAGSGGQVFTNIRGTTHGEKVPVLFLTAIPLDRVKTEVASSRSVRYMAKPIDMAQLETAIKELLAPPA